MHRVIRLQSLWSWLPAFRAVAETENIHAAAALLHLTPSTLSRAIKMLEADLGQTLFRRVGRGLELNGAGEELLTAARDAMRLLDEGLVRLEGGAAGPLRIACGEALALGAVLPSVQRLRLDHPRLLSELVPPTDDPVPLLLSGRLDLAFVHRAAPHRRLVIERLAAVRHSIYCGPEHPLRRCTAPSVATLAAHPFVVAPDDAWPPELARNVGLRVHQVSMAVASCAGGGWLACLPEYAPRLFPEGHLLHPLAVNIDIHLPLYALRRVPMGAADLAEELAKSVRQSTDNLLACAPFEHAIRNVAMDGRTNAAY